MKRVFKITLEGETYEVEVEEVAAGKPKAPAAAKAPPPKATPSTPEPPRVAPVSRPPVAKVAGEGVIPSPMPGTVTTVSVKAGDEVKMGDILISLESMKIHNEILAPKDGKVKEIFVAEGKYVRRGDPLIAIEG